MFVIRAAQMHALKIASWAPFQKDLIGVITAERPDLAEGRSLLAFKEAVSTAMLLSSNAGIAAEHLIRELAVAMLERENDPVRYLGPLRREIEAELSRSGFAAAARVAMAIARIKRNE